MSVMEFMLILMFMFMRMGMSIVIFKRSLKINMTVRNNLLFRKRLLISYIFCKYVIRDGL